MLPSLSKTRWARQELLKQLELPEGLFRSLIVDVPEIHQVLEHPLVQGVALGAGGSAEERRENLC